MSHELLSFSVGACVRQGSFFAFALKLRFKDGRDLFTAWPIPQTEQLMATLLRYGEFLSRVGHPVNSDSLEGVIEPNEPKLRLDEIENVEVKSIVEVLSSEIRDDRVLVVTINRATAEEPDVFLVSPDQCEWLIGYMGNTLVHFETNGDLTVPQGARH